MSKEILGSSQSGEDTDSPGVTGGSRSSARAVISRRRVVVGVFATLVLIGGGFSAFHLLRASHFAHEGVKEMREAEIHLRARRTADARDRSVAARTSFERSAREMRTLAPLLALGRHMPVIGPQIRAAEALTTSGIGLSTAGLHLSAAAEILAASPDPGASPGRPFDAVRGAQGPLSSALLALDAVAFRSSELAAYHLDGPLGRARDDLLERLGPVRSQVTAAADGVGALLTFAGDTGPRRYLVLSQNPDEVRPTGGFIGTYGVLVADGGRLAFERYDAIEDWQAAHPDAVLRPDQVLSPFRFYTPPRPQTLANVNSVPDWPHAARLAADLWSRAGEPPVDGVLAVTPGFLVRWLRVTGPVHVPQYDETVTATNVVERLDFHTHPPTPVAGDRKDFVAAVAHAGLRFGLDAPSSQWQALGQAVGEAFDAREALAWFVDPTLQQVVSDRGWDGTLPEGPGDFLSTAEFSYAAKNGRGLRRTYDHRVDLREDGSARISTTVEIRNSDPPDPSENPSSLSYITLYGARGAVIDRDASGDPTPEQPVAGRPGAGWFRAAEPLGTTSLTVVWEVPKAAVRTPDGALSYALRFLRVPDHSGDRLHLSVRLPPGWRWAGAAPPTTVELDVDVVGSWPFVAEHPRRSHCSERPGACVIGEQRLGSAGRLRSGTLG